jgi:hypothetical protein
MTDRELMQQALDALECMNEGAFNAEIKLLRARLAQPEPEPVAWMHDSHVGFNVPLYTAPPQREWQGLTDEEQLEIMKQFGPGQRGLFADAIEAKLKEKNT